MNITNLRMFYTQLILTCVLCISFYTMTLTLSLPGGISQFEKNFWGHEFLIGSLTQLRLTLGERVFANVLIGKDGWLEYTDNKNLDDYQNAIPTSPEMLDNIEKKIQRLYQQLKRRNITLLIVMAPNKATIYPEKLPDEIQKLGPKSNLDMLSASLKARGLAVLMDLRPALINGRKKQNVYYATDTHWNAYGAFIAYTEIMKELSKTYPALTPESIDNFNIRITQPSLRDIPTLIGATSLLESGIDMVAKEDNVKWDTLNHDRLVPIQVSTTTDNNSPTLLMYIDSFGNGTKMFIAPHFRKATFIQNDSRYPDTISLKKIDEIQPDIVIIEFVERYFSNEKFYDFLRRLLSEKR